MPKGNKKKEVNNPEVRENMYQVSDGLFGLEESLQTINDPKAMQLRQEVHDAYSKLYKYMTEGYLWD